MAYELKGKISLLELFHIQNVIQEKLSFFKDLAYKMIGTAYHGEVVSVSDGDGEATPVPVRQIPSEEYLASLKEVNDKVENLTDISIKLEKAIAQVRVSCGYDFESGAAYTAGS